jgi:hypothetical protein
MENSLPQCDQCNSPVTDSTEIEIENHGRVKLGKYIDGSWICNDCITEEKLSTASLNHDDSNSMPMNIWGLLANLMDLLILQRWMKPINNQNKQTSNSRIVK